MCDHVWLSSGYLSFPLQSKDMHVRFSGESKLGVGCGRVWLSVSFCWPWVGLETWPGFTLCLETNQQVEKKTKTIIKHRGPMGCEPWTSSWQNYNLCHHPIQLSNLDIIGLKWGCYLSESQYYCGPCIKAPMQKDSRCYLKQKKQNKKIIILLCLRTRTNMLW